MAPKRGQSIEHDEEHTEFMKRLADFHEKRGTRLELEPKVGIRHVDLLNLYKRVVEEGGYDLCSDTKAKPLMWRRFAEEFIGKNQYTAAQAFQVKQLYYKNLVAYEITSHWHKEPPPKEILEEVTAKGGNVMSRTVENYARPATREEKLVDNDASDTSPGQRTPKEEKQDPSEDPGSAAGRTTRGLRQQPPQRVLFQPDLTAQGRTRGQNQAVHASPTPGTTATNNYMNSTNFNTNTSSTLASYEPSQSYPLSLKPVITPSNNPEHYRNERKRKAESNTGPLARKYRNIMLPGTGFIGPNIYVRAQMALQSGIPEEEQYSLHHLVKISHERGDKYKFHQFPGLSDALVRKVLQVTGLFYDVDWDIAYDDSFTPDDEVLDGLNGTSGLIAKLKSRMPRIINDGVYDGEFLDSLNRIIEAALVIRNMCMLTENAKYVSRMPLVEDMITVVLNLPEYACLTELRHYALDIAEQVLRHCDIGAHDDLYDSLLAQLNSTDRGVLVTSLRTIARVGMDLEAPKRLENVPSDSLRKIQDLLLIEDEELRSACLDFLTQYTSTSANVTTLLETLDYPALVRRLTSLLQYQAQEQTSPEPSVPKEPETIIPPVPRLSHSVVEQLLQADEPERSSEWLRMCFLADAKSEMTQISLWQAYQGTFASYHATHPHLIAGEFIKNVSTVFTGATAQVAGQNKYVIRGIRSRKIPVETGMAAGSKPADKGKELLRCCFKYTHTSDAARDPTTGAVIPAVTREVECGEWFRSPDEMLKHICAEHLKLPKKPAPKPDPDGMDIDTANSDLPNGSSGDGKPTLGKSLAETFNFAAANERTHHCRWPTCQRSTADFPRENATALLVRHIYTHLPTSSSQPNTRNKKRPISASTTEEAEAPIKRKQVLTLFDEDGRAAGLPLGAALVLRNLARFVPGRANGEEAKGVRDGEEEGSLVEKVFGTEVRLKMVEAMAENQLLRWDVGAALGAVWEGEGA